MSTPVPPAPSAVLNTGMAMADPFPQEEKKPERSRFSKFFFGPDRKKSVAASRIISGSAGGVERGLLQKRKEEVKAETEFEVQKDTSSIKRNVRSLLNAIPPSFWENFFIPQGVYMAMIIIWAEGCYKWGFATVFAVAGILFFLNVICILGNLHAKSGFRNRVKHCAILSLFGTIFGHVAGVALSEQFFYPYHAFHDRRQYTDMTWDHPARGVGDAAGLQFKTGIRPDLAMVTGIQANGKIYCVAPIVKEGLVPNQQIQFWAVGLNCCHYRYDFTCGAAEDKDAHAGLVLYDYTQELPIPVPMRSPDWFYRKALNVSTAIYPLKTNTTEAVLLEWTKTVDVSDKFTDGVWSALATSTYFMLFIVPLALLLSFHHKKKTIVVSNQVAKFTGQFEGSQQQLLAP